MLNILTKYNLKFENYLLTLEDNGIQIVSLYCDNLLVRKDVVFTGKRPKAIKLFKVLTAGEREKITLTRKTKLCKNTEYKKEDFAGMVAESNEYGAKYIVKNYPCKAVEFLINDFTPSELREWIKSGATPKHEKANAYVCDLLPNYKLNIADHELFSVEELKR